MKNRIQTLNDVIHLVELRQADELKELKVQFNTTYESLKPISLIKSTLQEVTQSNEIKNRLIKTTVGMVIGYISKKILIGKSTNSTKNLIGNIIQFSIANALTRNGQSKKLRSK